MKILFFILHPLKCNSLPKSKKKKSKQRNKLNCTALKHNPTKYIFVLPSFVVTLSLAFSVKYLCL